MFEPIGILFFCVGALIPIAAMISFKRGFISGYTLGVEYASGAAFDVIINHLIKRNLLKKVWIDGCEFLQGVPVETSDSNLNK